MGEPSVDQQLAQRLAADKDAETGEMRRSGALISVAEASTIIAL